MSECWLRGADQLILATPSKLYSGCCHCFYITMLYSEFRLLKEPLNRAVQKAKNLHRRFNSFWIWKCFWFDWAQFHISTIVFYMKSLWYTTRLWCLFIENNWKTYIIACFQCKAIFIHKWIQVSLRTSWYPSDYLGIEIHYFLVCSKNWGGEEDPYNFAVNVSFLFE